MDLGKREGRDIERGKKKEDEKIIPKDANCKKMQLLVWLPQRSAWNLPMLKPNVPPAHVLPSLTVRVSVKDIIQCGREGEGEGASQYIKWCVLRQSPGSATKSD